MTFAGCTPKDRGMNDLPEISANIKKQLAFSCAQEKDRIPPHNTEADQLYRSARWLIKRNAVKQDATIYPTVERLLRIATAYGHDKANIELRGMLEKGLATSADPSNEVIDLVQDLIKRGIPSGYYDMGWYLEQGYGVKADKELAFKYYRKSADLGSPEGQYLVGDKLSDERLHGREIGAIGWAMYRCAAEQGHAKAANDLGIYLKQNERRLEALKYLQIAAANGSPVAASSLSDAFSEKDHADPTWGLGQAADPERQARYKSIEKFLSAYDYLGATVTDIDAIVPLPPAPLQSWNGKFKWLDEHEASVIPQMPPEERVAEMANSAGLDPKTGRPLKIR